MYTIDLLSGLGNESSNTHPVRVGIKEYRCRKLRQVKIILEFKLDVFLGEKVIKMTCEMKIVMS
jgi:hypothetical protein